MRAATLIWCIALPATFAKLLGVDIVAGTSNYGVMARVKVESADREPTILEADEQDNDNMTPEHLCLRGNRWTKFCKDLNVVQVLGHIIFTKPTEESRIVNMSTPNRDRATSWTASVSYSSPAILLRVDYCCSVTLPSLGTSLSSARNALSMWFWT